MREKGNFILYVGNASNDLIKPEDLQILKVKFIEAFSKYFLH